MSRQRSAPFQNNPLPASASILDALFLHWPEYVMEAVELGAFMLAACVFATLLFYSRSPLHRAVNSPAMRVVLMGLGMGVTAIAIIRSPYGRRSGAHINPAISLTFFFLGRIHRLDLLFYVVAQFIGGMLGVLLARIILGFPLASPSVRYVITIPGRFGALPAFMAEFFMGFATMSVVLFANGHRVLARYTWLLVGLLVTSYVIIFSSISGFGLNPARTVASALFAGVWTDIWLYLLAPSLGMLLGSGLYLLLYGPKTIYCAKIYHDQHSACPFHCRFQDLALMGAQDNGREYFCE